MDGKRSMLREIHAATTDSTCEGEMMENDKIVKIQKETPILSAKTGDLVTLETPHFDLVNDGKAVRVTQAVKHQAVYPIEDLLKLRQKTENELKNIIAILAEGEKLGAS